MSELHKTSARTVNLLEKPECENFAILAEHIRQLVSRNRLTTDNSKTNILPTS